MAPVMFSDYVNALRALLNLPPGAFIPLLMFLLVFGVTGRLFRALVLNGHWITLSLASLGSYAYAGRMVRDGQYVLAIIFTMPLLIIGKESYQRLAGVRHV